MSTSGGEARPDQVVCASSGLELWPVAQRAPSRVGRVHKGLFSLTSSPSIVRAFTSSRPPEALPRVAPGGVSLSW